MEDRVQHQRRIIKAILERYNAAAEAAYSITRWPDEEERNARACDAYAEAAGRVPLAIEHTILPTFDLQKQHDAQFMKVIGDLETELKNSFPFKLSLMIPMFAIQKGQQWAEIKETIKVWLLSNVAGVPTGQSKHSISGVPFEISLRRDNDVPPLFTVGRWLDSALNIPEQLTDRIAVALVDKDSQLSQYKKDGNETLLVMESQDIALVSSATIYKALLVALSKAKPSHISQVWLAEAYEPEVNYLFVYCLLGDQLFMDQVNPANAMFGPRYAKHWAEERSHD
jgi:hypothetical protein